MANHPDPDAPAPAGPDDLERNPGIGQSPGLDRRVGLEELDGDNTAEGGVENDVEPDGSVDPEHRPRDH